MGNVEFEVKKMEVPAIPEFNFDELKESLQEKTIKYENLIYNDNEITQAKKDRADLNKLKKAINDKRIAMEKEYLQPFNEFKRKVNEIIEIIDRPINAIDVQVKNYEAQVLEQRKKSVQESFEKLNPYEWLKLEQINNPKWLLASASKKSIEEDMQMQFNMIATELKSIESLDYADHAFETYKASLSMSKALEKVAELKELDKALAERKAKLEEAAREEAKAQEAVKEEPKAENKEEQKQDAPEEEKLWFSMQICLNSKDFDLFEAWTKENGIEWRLK